MARNQRRWYEGVMLRHFILALVVAGLAVPLVALPFSAAAQERIEVAQAKKRTLWDFLFGSKEEAPAEKTSTPRRSQSSDGQAALPEPSAPVVEKSPTATRLAVFGDSLAVDLAKALERAYAEDPDLVVVNQGVGSSGFVRDDFFDWNAAIGKAIAGNSFDIAVVIVGVNDRQNIRDEGGGIKPLTDEWKVIYSDRLKAFIGQVRGANKPLIWVGLPPMQAAPYSAAMAQISSLQRLAAFAGGAEFVDIYERFAAENGNYTARGPDLNGQETEMRKDDGIHFSGAGADKLAFYVGQALKLFYRGGTISVAIADPLAGTDAGVLARPPFQGLGQARHLEVAGAIITLRAARAHAGELITASPNPEKGFDLDKMVMAPAGRADAFGVGVEPEGVKGPK